MVLLIGPRLRAQLHWWRHVLRWPPRFHRLCRLSRWWGLESLVVFCECGVVFGTGRRLTLEESRFAGRLIALWVLEENGRQAHGDD